MSRPVSSFEANLPGYGALRETSGHDLRFDASAYQLADKFNPKNPPGQYLKNPAYDQYMRIHKVLVGESGAKRLLEIADSLSTESLPTYLDAAGSAYMEAAIALQQESTVGRIELADLAEGCWQRSLLLGQKLVDDLELRGLYEDSDQFRTATALAFSPLQKSLIVGNVTSTIRQRTFADMLAIAETSAVQLDLAWRQKHREAMDDHVGFLHESNVLLGLLHLDDPRYVPSPSFNRSDNGVYHRKQSHDIVIFNQHWGKIKKIIPVEVKGKASKSDRARYQALLVRDKMHMIASHGFNPVDTLRSFSNIHSDTASQEDHNTVSFATENLLELLRMYQKSGGKNLVNTSSPTTFHDSRLVQHLYTGN